ncbi:ABC transporter permease [Granulicella sibirica]|uniref:Fe2+ ABC transporter, permease protein 2 n=1 Tax=Granulicella sibirica TaxID=2479048 RepID=A0A4Q0T059_9BACT|nr:ABC transporter permease [Granulicella sibirica]RXH55308.1 Fe2+ ABC transporter, permease protein 2 [Granulicella sibirica]
MAVATEGSAASAPPGERPLQRRGLELSLSRMLRRSLIHRKARTMSALVALTVSAAVATALLTLYADLDAKLHHEFRSFGANVVVTAAPTGEVDGAAGAPAPIDTVTSESLPANATTRVLQEAGPDAIGAEFGYAVATTDRGSPVVVVGTDFNDARKLDAWWQVSAWPIGTEDALLGVRAANFVADTQDVKLMFAGKEIVLRGVGTVKTGGDEDSRIYMPMAAFTKWTGAGAGVIEVQVPGGAAKVQASIDRMRSELKGMQVQPVRQLVEGESRIVERTHALMYGAVLLIAMTVGVSVLATMSASVLERRRDFALMKALGGSQGQLVGMFLLEALVIALAGVVVGFVIGSGMALLISELNFHTATLPRLQVLPAVILLNGFIAVVAALFPARVLRGLEPAALLKGE